MIKVITYGTFDRLHYGHIRLLERAKALGDYLIVGITSEDFDKSRGKINVQQTLMERIENVRSVGIADEIIVEEYEGQKIDDIRRYGIDVFTVGSDWVGKFDYLKEYCEVVYLERTEGISSSEIRATERKIRMGLIGDRNGNILTKYARECRFVNGIELIGIAVTEEDGDCDGQIQHLKRYESDKALIGDCDAVYIGSHPAKHKELIRKAIEQGKHVLCESPIALTEAEVQELFEMAEKKGVVLMDAIKTAYSMAYDRLLLIVKGGKIGKVISIDATCTSLREIREEEVSRAWNSICGWGPTAMLPVFQIMGTAFSEARISTFFRNEMVLYDGFTQIHFQYPNGVATIKVGDGVKSEGELVISGTDGYIYVPAPWWKTDYFELRYEDPTQNKRYFYQLDGEGIRYELVAFVKAIESKRNYSYISKDVSIGIARMMEQFYERRGMNVIA